MPQDFKHTHFISTLLLFIFNGCYIMYFIHVPHIFSAHSIHLASSVTFKNPSWPTSHKVCHPRTRLAVMWCVRGQVIDGWNLIGWWWRCKCSWWVAAYCLSFYRIFTSSWHTSYALMSSPANHPRDPYLASWSFQWSGRRPFLDFRGYIALDGLYSSHHVL